ncbi:MAG: bifunctional 4-hydroxy-2-oxoglutarate aldolase/2-dehydro-3-deoxy-phosphogluconate aldolase [Cyclobacteriaceae bacterium]
MNQHFSWDKYHQAPMVGIVRGESKETVLKIARAYQDAEMFTLEVTLNTPGATDIIQALRAHFPDLNIGAGTVCNVEDLDEVIRAGAQFIVTPIIDEAVIKQCVQLGIPIFPGAYSPSEIYKAWSLGASAVKLFPATDLGTGYIKDVLAPLNDIKLVPTGGVNLENIRSWFEVGSVGVGMGSSLINKELIAAEDYDGLTTYFRQFKEAIRDFIQ